MSELTFQGMHIDHPSARDKENGMESRIFLILTTPAGRAREVDLTDAQVLTLIERGAKFLGIKART